MKKTLIYIIVLTLILSCVSCTISDGENDNLSTSSEQSEADNSSSLEEESSTEIMLIDQAGREVILNQPAQTIVSSYYITTYASIALGISDKLIGIEKKAETRPIYSLAASDLLEVTQVGSLKEFNVEAVAELNPELVLMPISLLEQATTLEELGITVLVVDPETKEGLNQMITNIGILTGSEDRANAIINAQNEIYDTISALVEGKENPKVYMGSNSSYLETATAQMYQNDLIMDAGGENVFSSIDDNYWSAVSYETILEQNPDYFIIPSAAAYTVEDVLNDSALQDINAVKNAKVFKMPDSYEEIDSPVPSGVLGVYWLAVTLHGTAEDVVDFEETFGKFYKDFYGIDVE